MNKFIKCWVFIICLLFIFLILFTDSVNAESCSIFNNYNFNELTNISYTATNGKYSYNKTLTNAVSVPSNYQNSLLKGKLWLSVLSNSNTMYSNIDWDLTCNNTQWVQSQQSQSYTITYADGSHATISGNETDYEAFCSNYNMFEGLNIQYNYTPVSNIINMRLTTNNGLIPCIVDSGGAFTCYLNNTSSITGVWVDLVTSYATTNGVSVRFGWTDYAPLICTDNAQQIINNNNSNTQQVINSQNNINNSITSNDVTGNNSSSSITSIGNTFNSQEDFLLNLLTIPYTLWSSILNVFSNTCSPLDVGTMFNYHLVFPCIELNDFLGGIYATIIDVIFTAIIYSAFIRRVIKYFRELLTLDEHALITGGVKLW